MFHVSVSVMHSWLECVTFIADEKLVMSSDENEKRENELSKNQFYFLLFFFSVPLHHNNNEIQIEMQTREEKTPSILLCI